MNNAGEGPVITGHRVFISYCNEDSTTHTSDRNVADLICAKLESQGIPYWIDHKDIEPGDDWLSVIIDAVEKSKVVILVLSKKTEKSVWVKDEITLALNKNIKVIPFRIDDVEPQGALRILKVRCQWLDAFTPPLEKHIERLVQVVRNHLEKERESPPLKEGPPGMDSKEKIEVKPGKTQGRMEKPQEPDTGKKGYKIKNYPQKKQVLIAASNIIFIAAAVFILSYVIGNRKTNPVGKTTDISTTSDKKTPPGENKEKEPVKNQHTEKKVNGTTPVENKDKELVKNQPTVTKDTGKQGTSKIKNGEVEVKEVSIEKPGFIIDLEKRGDVRVTKNNHDTWEAFHKDYGITMIYIPAGEFTMGSEKPPHKVYLDGYWIGKYEVTFSQYDKYCEMTGKEKPGDRGWGRENRPVINVSWEDAAGYCQWLSGQTELKFNLPTEAQWEKAARGIDSRQYPWGNTPPSDKLVNFADKQLWLKKKYDWADKNIDDGYVYTAPVGSYPDGAFPYGILDMAGNVWEWCADLYDGDYYKNSPKINPQGPETGSPRVSRGGSWIDGAGICACATRGCLQPTVQVSHLGFRLVRSL